MTTGERDPDIKALQDAVFWTKVARARRTPMAEKILDGPRLFDQSCEIMRGGIRSENPQFTPEQVEQELRRRLAIARRIDDAGLYRDAGTIDESLRAARSGTCAVASCHRWLQKNRS